MRIQWPFSTKKKIDVHNHRDRKSKRQGCNWHANINSPQNASAITLTTFDNTHNHPLDANAQHYAPIYQNIPEDVLKEIQFLTKNGNLTISTQRRLLKAKFPDESILDCDLANAIQKFKICTDENLDASHLLTTLIERKSHDHQWTVEFELNNENRLTCLFWMLPEQIVLWLKQYDVILNDNIAKTNWYQMSLSLFLAVNNNTRSRLVA